jgi:hypothetical protein
MVNSPLILGATMIDAPRGATMRLDGSLRW